MRRGWVWALVALVGCSGAATTGVEDDADEPGPDAGAVADSQVAYDSPTSPYDGGADVIEPDVRTTSDSGVDAPADSAPDAYDAAVMDSSVTADSHVEVDAGYDSGPDVNVPDTNSPAVDAGSDAADEADTNPPPPFCTSGTYRCTNFTTEQCNGFEWVEQSGDQRCCNEPGRYTVTATTATDSRTGLVWKRQAGFAGTRAVASSGCETSSPAGRLPTSAELSQLVIGAPVNNVSVCSPTIDQVAFMSVSPSDTWTSDGCVDMIRGTSKATCSVSTSTGFVCVY